MVLKGRLKLLYDMIPPCDILSDIGTDHALLPAYALLNGRCKRAIACDVREGPLESAKRTLKQFNLQNKMDLRLGSGLEPISQEEADCVVLAGMGGILTIELLNDSLKKAQSANHIFLQPMVKQEVVRPFLWQNGFEVLDEGLAREGDKLYQAILVHYTGKVREHWDSINEVIGEKLISKKDSLLLDWVNVHIRRQDRIVRGLLAAKTTEEPIQKEKALLIKLQELLNTLT